MNSMIKKYKNKDCTCLPKDDSPHCGCTCNENNLALKCGEPISAIAELPIVPGTTGTPITVARVTVDTSCLEEPQIKLNFVVDIASIAGGIFTNIALQVFKFRYNMSERIPVGQEWFYKDDFTEEVIDSFSFFVFDSDAIENECYTYILEATPYS